MTDSHGAEHAHPEGLLVTRRQVVGGMVTSGVVVAASGLVPEWLGEQHAPDYGASAIPEPRGEVLAAPETEEHGSRANDMTAYVMTGGFIGLVLGNTVEMQPFDRTTAKFSWTAETGRLVALKAAGDDEAFRHDMAEFFAFNPAEGQIGSVYFLGFLPVMADVASNVKVDMDGLRESGYHDEHAERSIQEAKNTMFDAAVEQPDFDDTTEVWREFEGKAKDSFIESYATGMGAVEVSAPAFSTYLGARSMTETIKEVFVRSYNHNVAKGVLAARSHEVSPGEYSDIENIPIKSELEIKQDAVKAANKVVSGMVFGVMKNAVALGDNAAGECLLGDPPEVVFGAAHATKPVALLRNEAIGFGLAQATGLMHGATFLIAHGFAKDIPSAMRHMAKGQARAAMAIKDSFFDPNIRQESWGGNQKIAEKIMDAVNNRYASGNTPEATVNRVRELVRSIPQPTLEMDMRTYLRNKTEYILGKANDNRHINWLVQTAASLAPDHVSGETVDTDLPSHLAELRSDADFLERFVRHTGETPRDYMRRITVWMDDLAGEERSRHISSMTAVFNEMQESVEEAGEVQNHTAQLADLLPPEIFNRRGLSMELRRKGLANQISARAYQLITGEDREVNQDNVGEILEIFGVLTGVDVSIVRSALRESSDMQHGLERDPESIDTLLGEEGEEVFGALGTQIPYVPSLVHTAEKGLSNLDSFEAKVKMTMGLTVAVSAFGDNVAAFLFGWKVLSKLYREEQGAEQFDANTQLQTDIAIGALKIAEAAGALSKLGNGPNFVIRGIEGSINENTGQLEMTETKLKMADSLINPYALSQTVATCVLMKQLINQSSKNQDFALAG